MKLENGLLPLRKEGSSTHNVLEGQEIASQTGSFMYNVPRIEEQFQDSVLQQPMRKPRRQSKHSFLFHLIAITFLCFSCIYFSARLSYVVHL